MFEREFVADFARDLPWHHYPALTALGDDDKQRLAALVRGRAEWFKPDFAPLYKALAGTPELDVTGVRKAKCLDAAYAAGVRIAPPPADDLEFVTTGRPEVVVRRKGGHLFAPDPAARSSPSTVRRGTRSTSRWSRHSTRGRGGGERVRLSRRRPHRHGDGLLRRLDVIATAR